MEIYEQPNRLKLILAICAAVVGVALVAVSFVENSGTVGTALTIVVAIGLFALSVVLFCSYYKRLILLRADEDGVLTMYLFYLPWSEIDGFYIKDDAFVEIKLKDNEAYIENMDRDLYTLYYDGIERGIEHGHEAFFIPAAQMRLDCTTVLTFLETARKNYAK